MRCKITLLLIFFVFGLSAQTVSDYFIAMPDSLLPVLAKNRRRDMVDYAVLNRKDRVKNNLNGDSYVDTLTNNFLRVRLSDASTLDIKYIEHKKSPLLVLVTTTCAPLCDSRIEFYSTKWQLLPLKSFFNQPNEYSFFKKEKSCKEAPKKLDMFFISYQLSPSSNDLKVVMQVKESLPDFIYSDILPCLNDSLLYQWKPTSKGGKFVLSK